MRAVSCIGPDRTGCANPSEYLSCGCTLAWVSAIVATVVLLGGCGSPSQSQGGAAEPHVKVPQAAEPTQASAELPESEAGFPPGPGEEIVLFDGKTLGQWKPTDFGGQGDVSVKDAAIHLQMGSYMTGVTWTGPVVRMSYEITLDAMRVDGSDFFCGMTFPVAENPCTLVLGGWGGSVCGLSNIGYYDASENETTTFRSFENGRWYHVR